MRALGLAVFLCLTATGAVAQAMPPGLREALGLPAPAIDDVAGWDVTRWGMTAEHSPPRSGHA